MHLIHFFTIKNISIRVKRSNFTLVFLKDACHADLDAIRKRARSIYFKTHICKVFKYISKQ